MRAILEQNTLCSRVRWSRAQEAEYEYKGAAPEAEAAGARRYKKRSSLCLHLHLRLRLRLRIRKRTQKGHAHEATGTRSRVVSRRVARRLLNWICQRAVLKDKLICSANSCAAPRSASRPVPSRTDNRHDSRRPMFSPASCFCCVDVVPRVPPLCALLGSAPSVRPSVPSRSVPFCTASFRSVSFLSIPLCFALHSSIQRVLLPLFARRFRRQVTGGSALRQRLITRSRGERVNVASAIALCEP